MITEVIRPIEDARVAIESQGINLRTISQNGTKVIESRFQGFTRSLTVNPNQEVRLIPEPHVNGVRPQREIGPLLVIVEPDRKTMGVAKLAQVPKGVSTDVFFAPKDTDAALVDPEKTRMIEQAARERVNGFLGPQQIGFEASTLHELGLEGRGTEFTVIVEEDSIAWIPPKELRIRRTTLQQFVHETTGNESPEQVAQFTEVVKAAPVLIEQQKKLKNEPGEYVKKVLASSNPQVQEYFKARYAEYAANLHTRAHAEDRRVSGRAETEIRRSFHEENFPLTSQQVFTDSEIAVTAAFEIKNLKRRILTEVGLQYAGGIPFDIAAQRYLDISRGTIRGMSEEAINAFLSKTIQGTDLQDYKRIMKLPEVARREEAAWVHARTEAQKALIELGEKHATTADLDRHGAGRKTYEGKRRIEAQGVKDEVVDSSGERVPVKDLFSARGESILSVDDWCTLPLRPVVIPDGRPESNDPRALAEFISDNILYSRQVCDREGTQVGMSPEAREQYVTKVKTAIEQGKPIVATEYTPLAAIGNPLKRNTQEVALAEVDFARRLAQIAVAVEMYYPQGLHWIVGNEVPAFSGPDMLNLSPEYVEKFHADMEKIMRKVDPEGKRLSMIRMDELLWGTEERRKAWEAYRSQKSSEMQAVLTDPNHPNHERMRSEITTFTYPMATCTNPYQFGAARQLPVTQVAQVSEALRQFTHSEIRGVGVSTSGEKVGYDGLNAEQKKLFKDLLEKGANMAFIYRLTMGARDVLPAFAEAIPAYAVAYTMVTKKDKPVLYPNSGKGAIFPAHGEPVLQRSTVPKQRTSVTVRPWWQIVAQRDNYKPVYCDDKAEPLYYEEVL